MKPDAMDQQAFDLMMKKDWPALVALVEQGRWDANRPIPDGSGGKMRYWLLAMLIDGRATEAALSVIRKGATLDVWQEGWTPLMLACQYQNHAVINALIEAGANINLRAPRGEDGGGETALILAAEQMDLWAVRRLLEAGADVSLATRAGEPALAIAARSAGAARASRAEHVELIRLLAAAGCPLLGSELHQPIWNRDFPM